jgi:hypothetical protein
MIDLEQLKTTPIIQQLISLGAPAGIANFIQKVSVFKGHYKQVQVAAQGVLALKNAHPSYMSAPDMCHQMGGGYQGYEGYESAGVTARRRQVVV